MRLKVQFNVDTIPFLNKQYRVCSNWFPLLFHPLYRQSLGTCSIKEAVTKSFFPLSVFLLVFSSFTFSRFSLLFFFGTNFSLEPIDTLQESRFIFMVEMCAKFRFIFQSSGFSLSRFHSSLFFSPLY